MTAVITPDVLATAPLVDRTPWAEPEPRRPKTTIELVVVNDQPVVRQAIVDVLASRRDIVVAGASGSVDEALTLEPARADVFLVSLSHSSLDTIEGVTQILGARPNAAVVVLAGPTPGSEIMRAFEAGASGYLFTDAEPEELVHGVRAAAAGETPLSAGAAREFLAARRMRRSARPLTTREIEILDLVRAGCRNKQIGRRLGISEKTVKAHLTRIFGALGVSDRTQAALHADGQRTAR